MYIYLMLNIKGIWVYCFFYVCLQHIIAYIIYVSMDRDRINEIITESINNVLNDGIVFDPITRTVAYNPGISSFGFSSWQSSSELNADHLAKRLGADEDHVDNAMENNPTIDHEIGEGINVWSVFKRKSGNALDTDPLVYSLTNKEGWHFRRQEDHDAIEKQFNLVACKFAGMYPMEVTIIIPGVNELNYRIVEVVMSKSANAQLIQGVICKMTTEEVNDIVLEMGSKFREYYKGRFNDAYYQLCTYLEEMDEKRNDTFSRQFVIDQDMRNVLDMTLKVSEDRYAEFANKINGQHVLIIDDTISRGQSIKNACEIMSDSYAPKSITVLRVL